MRLFVFFIVCIIFFNLHAESNDTISARQLNEVVVLGDRGWIENGVINFIPSKSEKNYQIARQHLLNPCIFRS